MGADEYGEGLRTVNPQLLEIMGRSYVIECCITAFRVKQEELIYREYVTTMLRGLARSEAPRYMDIIKPSSVDEQNVVEKVNDIKDRMRGINDESAESGGDIIA